MKELEFYKMVFSYVKELPTIIKKEMRSGVDVFIKETRDRLWYNFDMFNKNGFIKQKN